MPVTSPLAEIEPIAVLLLAHEPPVAASVSNVDAPGHTTGEPSIGEGSGLTVTTAVIMQPVPIVYVIFTVPAVPPVTVTEPAIVILPVPVPVLHVPPPGVSLSVVVEPEQTVSEPIIGTGKVFTVTTAVVIQPVGKV